MRLAPWRVQTRPAPGLVSVSTRVAAWLALAARENAEQPWQRWTRTGWRLWSESRSRPMILDEEMVS